jgi:hypothetical protein
VGGGAWSFVVRGAICLINFDNERDSGLLNSLKFEGTFQDFLAGKEALFKPHEMEQ